jgi:hypothetical protein
MSKRLVVSLLFALALSSLRCHAQIAWLFTTVHPGSSGQGGFVMVVGNAGWVASGNGASGGPAAPPPAPTPVVCAYSLGVASANLGGGPVGDLFAVKAPGGCSWTAQAGASWIHTASSGTGDGWVNYVVDPNPTGALRTGTLTVGGQTFTVNQAPQGYIWHDVFGWLYTAGNGWYHANGFGWIWYDSAGQWIWSTGLQGWLAITDHRARRAWSTQYGWITMPASDSTRLETATLGTVHIGRHGGSAIPEGWVVSERFGYVWPAGDGQWFYTEEAGWIGATPQGGLWAVEQGRFL